MDSSLFPTTGATAGVRQSPAAELLSRESHLSTPTRSLPPVLAAASRAALTVERRGNASRHLIRRITSRSRSTQLSVVWLAIRPGAFGSRATAGGPGCRFTYGQILNSRHSILAISIRDGLSAKTV